MDKNVPNADTSAALRELKEMEEHLEKYRSYSTFHDLLSEVLAEEEP